MAILRFFQSGFRLIDGDDLNRILSNFTPVTLTVSGAISGASLAVTGAISGASAAITNLLSTGSLQLDTGTKTATSAAGAATLNKKSGVVTSEALTTAAGATWTLTLTNSKISATSQVLVSIGNGTNAGGSPALTTVTPGAGSAVIIVQNIHATDAFNGTLKVTFAVLDA